jgi:hypothetical protein
MLLASSFTSSCICHLGITFPKLFLELGELHYRLGVIIGKGGAQRGLCLAKPYSIFIISSISVARVHFWSLSCTYTGQILHWSWGFSFEVINWSSILGKVAWF